MATGGNIGDLTSIAAVHSAISEFRDLGREAFLERYGFKRSRNYFLVVDGIGYDSKPVSAAAYGIQHGRKHSLHFDDFSGGAPVVAALKSLNFTVARWISPQLEAGAVYTRKQLREMFGIADATIDNGVFRPKDFNSIWLFVTCDKTKDRTPYQDRFDDDLLYWQGQLAGRREQSIIQHEDVGDELLVFYRGNKRQYPGAGFRFEGQFRYISHEGAKPANFVLQRSSARDDAEISRSEFDPTSIEDGRKRVWAEVKRRQGQPAFRRRLIRAYGGRCAVTGCGIEQLLEAAHIVPYQGPKTNDVRNGLLLRADIHTLFDLGSITISETGRIRVASALRKSYYGTFHEKPLRYPVDTANRPSAKSLTWHRNEHAKGTSC